MTHPDSLAETHAKVASLLQGGGTSCVLEKKYVRKDGELMWGVTNITAVRNDAGQVVSLIAFVLDVTERKRTERSAAFLAELTARLGAARDEKEILRSALEALVEFLRVPQAYFAECNEAENRLLVSGRRTTFPPGSFTASFSLEQLGGTGLVAKYCARRRGRRRRAR